MTLMLTGRAQLLWQEQPGTTIYDTLYQVLPTYAVFAFIYNSIVIAIIWLICYPSGTSVVYSTSDVFSSCCLCFFLWTNSQTENNMKANLATIPPYIFLFLKNWSHTLLSASELAPEKNKEAAKICTSLIVPTIISQQQNTASISHETTKNCHHAQKHTQYLCC